jgi:hypothetical protein
MNSQLKPVYETTLSVLLESCKHNRISILQSSGAQRCFARSEIEKKLHLY